jgi:hypothetical protein
MPMDNWKKCRLRERGEGQMKACCWACHHENNGNIRANKKDKSNYWEWEKWGKEWLIGMG